MTPVVYDDPGEARNNVAARISAGWAKRRRGTSASSIRKTAGLVADAAFMGVMNGPGAMALTVMPSAAHSMASDLVSWTTAPLAVAQADHVRWSGLQITQALRPAGHLLDGDGGQRELCPARGERLEPQSLLPAGGDFVGPEAGCAAC